MIWLSQGIYLHPMYGLLQFSLDFSTCPKTGTLCVKVGPKPAFIPLSNSCIQSYNSPGLLVEYIINMQQDPNALFSQSLGASSNFYFSDHDLCLLFNEGKPRCQRFDLHKISKSSLTWSLCQVYGSLLANQSEPSNVHKNWILWCISNFCSN